MASVSSPRLRPMSSMIALAPSKSRSRWRSRKAGWPARTRSPSHTPSPRTKPESNTDTTARSRGTRSPFTQIRMLSFRGSSSKSWVPWGSAATLLSRPLVFAPMPRVAEHSPKPKERPMFFHHKELAYTVRVDKPNPVFGRMLQQAIGGPEGEMRVMNQYLFQAWSHRGPKKYRDMLLHTGTEEIGHIEVLATAVAMNLDGLPSEKVDDVVTNPLVSARMGGVEPRHYLSAGLAAMPADANGVPFNANCIDVGGNLLANMRANVAAEAIGRSLASRLREMTDDPGMIDLLSFLIARDTMHQQQWLAAIEDAGDTINNAPNDVEDEGEYRQWAYQFFGHGEEP